jgi:acetyl esterase/lipase
MLKRALVAGVLKLFKNLVLRNPKYLEKLTSIDPNERIQLRIELDKGMKDSAMKSVEQLKSNLPNVQFDQIYVEELSRVVDQQVSLFSGQFGCRFGVERVVSEYRSFRYQAGKGKLENETHAILYVHGGAFVMSCVEMYAGFLLHLSLGCGGIPVFAIEYPLSPEFQFPAALNCVVEGFRNLIWRGFESIVIAGDSAGGNLAVAACLKLMELGEKLPSAIVLMSPWLDLTHSGQSVKDNADIDPLIPAEMLSKAAAFYVEEDDVKNPLVSPLFASKEQVMNLPPVLIHVGDREILLDDSVRFIKHVDSKDSELVIWEGMHHVFPVSIGTLKEADAAMEQMCEFINKHNSKT